jgi:hypothetical protein
VVKTLEAAHCHVALLATHLAEDAILEVVVAPAAAPTAAFAFVDKATAVSTAATGVAGVSPAATAFGHHVGG